MVPPGNFSRSRARNALLVTLSLALASCATAQPDPSNGTNGSTQGSVGDERTERDRLVLTVVTTNDVHGRARRLGVIGGFVDNLRAERARDGGGVLLVDAGDMWQGTLASNLAEGAPMIRAYEALGYDAATIGNHEFDYGPAGDATTPEDEGDDPRGALLARVKEAGFPILAANILDAETSERVDWPGVEPSVIREVAGVRVGIVGVTSEETLRTTISANVRGLAMAPVAETIADQARALRERGADIVVVAAHLGGNCDRFDDPRDLSSCNEDAEVFEVARALPEGLVDVIAGGHTHAGVAHEVGGIPIVEAFATGRAFGRVDLVVDRETHEVLDARIHPPHPVCGELDTPMERCEPGEYAGRPVRPHEGVVAAVRPALRHAKEAQQRELGVTLASAAPRAYDEESPLGNLLADLMLEARPSVDVAIINGGGIRADLPAGALTYGTLYEAFPFDNRFAVVELTASRFARVLARNLRHDGGILSIAGLHARARCEDGELAIELRTPDGEPLDGDTELEVLASDYLVTGGDDALAEAIADGASSEIEDGKPLRDVLAGHLSEHGGTLEPQDHFDAKKPRLDYPGPRPVRCEGEGDPD